MNIALNHQITSRKTDRVWTGKASQVPVQRSVVPGLDVLQRKEGQCACGGGCPRCQKRIPLQAKLAISEPGDPFELEADRVADAVMRMPDGSAGARIERFTGGAAVSRSRASCTRPDAEGADLSSVVARGTSGGGHVLDRETRAFMEPRLGRDFGDVRVHTGTSAAESAQSIGAVAYTAGRDIVFGAGHYAPHTTQGRRLLSHELTHTVQQGSDATPRVGRVAVPDVHTGAQGLVQRVVCTGKSKSNCYGNCTHGTSGRPGNCLWSGTIANGCVCYEKPTLSPAKEILYDLVMAALIAVAVVLTLAAIAAIIACLMGPCEVAALIAALGFGAAMIVMGIIGSGGGGASTGGETAAAGAGEAPSEAATV